LFFKKTENIFPVFLHAEMLEIMVILSTQDSAETAKDRQIENNTISKPIRGR